ncbi:MAG: TIGR04255 family protein [Azoarcus sp.]|nr:TIGR04255 family protein [Azoarcus sp.]
MSKWMSNAPVYYALAQARFNPVNMMSKYVDEIQDRLRGEYPQFGKQQLTQLVIPGHGQAQGASPQVEQTTSWLLTRSDGTAGFILAPWGITFHTIHYQTHEQFIPELLAGLKTVHDVVKLDHVSRLGLRYLDAVLPRNGETVEEYLVGGLHGIKFDATRRYTMTESMFTTEVKPLLSTGTLVTRVYRMNAPLGYPVDIAPNGLAVNPAFVVKEPLEHVVIDTDHFVEGQMPLDMNRLDEQLLSLHGIIKSVFVATTTDYARKAWGLITGE